MVLFFEYIKKYKGFLALALLLAAINQIFSLMDPQITRLIIDNYAIKFDQMPREVFIKGVSLLLFGFIGVALVSRIAKNFQDYFVNSITQRVGTDMYSDSVRHTFSLPYGIFEDRRSGEVLQKLQKARQDTQKLIESSINVIFLSAIGMVFIIGYAFYVHWSIGLTFVISIPLMGGFVFFISKKIGRAQKEIVKESAELSGATTETLRNVELVKSLGLENQEINRLNDVNKKILGLELKKIKYIRLLSFIQGTIVNGVRAGLLFLMLFLLYNRQVTLGEFLSLFFYSFFIFGPLGEISSVVSHYQEAKASNSQLKEILDIKPEPEPKNMKEIDKISSIKFQNVSFKYNDSLGDSISNVNIDIKNGERIAFAGPSGSGKTTMVKLILGLYKPNKGKIIFNNTDSKKIDYHSLRKKIGLVSQETQLFAGTIRENLLFVNPNAGDEKCLEAIKMASAQYLLDKTGKGLETKIGEGGIKLSGGEKQRLAIARALLREPEIIIFDEATSALDSLTEKEITETVKKVSKSRPDLIVISIAHRLSTIAHVDKTYVMEKGKIIERGNHKSLLKKKGLYSALWTEQVAED
ncbi:ABC transporter ATP-binding protein [Candidatus Pacearchaeota archaeon]|nr:ABC transporter ATP-binding protein [Candidatus Pacearchaeota archaeon]